MTGREPSRFDLLPAIDLIDGRVVRLRRGSFNQADIFGDDPAAVAERFAAAGARWLHLVDLDGARAGEPRQLDVIRRVIAAAGPDVACEVAGGLRTHAAVEAAIEAGARRAVLGTTALREPAIVRRLIEEHGPERIAAAIDVRDGLALGDAWQGGGEGTAVERAVGRLRDAGAGVFEVTAIERDGLLTGPDLALLESVVALGVDVIASGGIRSIEDLRAVRGLGCTGAIVGRALYDGSLDPGSAMVALGG